MDSPVGAIATARDVLRTQLANCHYWRNAEGLSLTVDQAKTRIYQTFPLETNLKELAELRPFAVIHKPLTGVEWKSTAAPRLYQCGGELAIEFHFAPGDLVATDPGDRERELENTIAQIVQTQNLAEPGLLDLANSAGYHSILSIREDGPYRVAPEDLESIGDCWTYWLFVQWGIRQ